MQAFSHKNILSCIPWLGILAWCNFVCITALSAVCVYFAVSITPPPESKVFVCDSLLQFIALIKPVFKTGTRTECFAILGLAGSVIPAVYNAGTKRMKGILISEMTKYFFPLYGVVMLQNFLLSIAGQLIEGMDHWQYLLLPTLVTTAYSVVLVLATGLFERVSQGFVGAYIIERSRILRPRIYDRKSSSHKNKRATFLADMGSHIATQLVATNTPHCNTDKHLRKEIRQIAKFMLPDSVQKKLKKKKPQCCRDEFDLLFSISGITDASLCDSVYFELPASEFVRNSFALQIEFSSEFWNQVLGSMPSQNDKIRAACRIFDAMGCWTKKSYGSFAVMSCGLISYLYKDADSSENGHHNRSADYCVEFVKEMWTMFCVDIPFLNSGDSIPTAVVSLYAEMLLIIFAISTIEQYLQLNQVSEDLVKQSLDAFWKSAHVHIGRELVMNEPFKQYLALALCVIRQLPSQANMPLSIAQKKRLQNYAISQKSKIGA